MKIELVVIGDKNKYKSSNGEAVGNIYEKKNIKVAKDIDVLPMNAHVRLIQQFMDSTAISFPLQRKTWR
mgnify:FL=1|jgi:hypothetical protein